MHKALRCPVAGGNNHHNLKHYKTFIAVSSRQGWPRRSLQDYFAGEEYYGGRESLVKSAAFLQAIKLIHPSNNSYQFIR